MKLSFHGATREVTGACYLLETAQTKILVDCGLFQGTREYEEQNFEKFGFDPGTVEAIFVTHGHLDHVGRIPKLVKEGFRGTIYSTAPTRGIAEFILRDGLNVGQKEREREPLYSEEDLERTFELWKTAPYHTPIRHKGATITFYDAGHILGSSIVGVVAEGKKIVFTGDLGNVPSALLPPPEAIPDANFLVIESTYGNRVHEATGERVLHLERAVEDAASRGGTLMIPAFATERTQDILYHLNEMVHFKRVPEIPVFVDAPLAIKITSVFEQYPEFYKDEIKDLYRKHPNLFRFKRLKFTSTVEESKSINTTPPPKVILAGSGMLAGGRILHHARRYLPDPKSILLIIGYQAPGSLGRRLVDGDKMVKIFGEDVLVEAEIRNIYGFSAHADNPQLFAFIETNRDTLKRVFMVHGEDAQALHLAQEVKDRLGIQADAPVLHESFEI